MRFDLGPPIRAPPFWIWPRFSRVQSESVILPLFGRLPWFTRSSKSWWAREPVQSYSVLFPFGHPYCRRRTGRGHSEPPGFAGPGCSARMLGPEPRPSGAPLLVIAPYGFTAAQPPVKAPPNAHPPNVPWMPRPMATLGFLPLPVFDAVSGNRMMTRHGRLVYYVNVDITHTVADVEPVLRRMFSNPRLTVGRPIPEDTSLPIRAVTRETKGRGCP
jgi:hypothetical protein